jgi:hypothetical protein
MSIELLSPEVDLELQKEVENDDQMPKDMVLNACIFPFTQEGSWQSMVIIL